jgi:hypothetical protein
MGLVDDEALLLQAEDRLADRPAADIELGGEVILDQPHAGGELSAEDRLAYGIGDVVHEDAPLARPERQAVRIRHRFCLQSTEIRRHTPD